MGFYIWERKEATAAAKKRKRCERLRCTYNLAKIGDFHSCLAFAFACLLNILKAVKRDSTIKNINVPCRFSSSRSYRVRTYGFGIWNFSSGVYTMRLGRKLFVRSLAWLVSRSLYLSSLLLLSAQRFLYFSSFILSDIKREELYW